MNMPFIVASVVVAILVVVLALKNAVVWLGLVALGYVVLSVTVNWRKAQGVAVESRVGVSGFRYQVHHSLKVVGAPPLVKFCAGQGLVEDLVRSWDSVASVMRATKCESQSVLWGAAREWRRVAPPRSGSHRDDSHDWWWQVRSESDECTW